MAGDALGGDGGEARQDVTTGSGQNLVLGGCVGYLVRPLQFDADGEVVAVLPVTEARLPGVPGAFMQINVLDEFAIAADQQVAGYPQPGDGTKIGMGLGIEAILEEGIDPGATKLAGRQADTMDDQQVHGGAGRAFIPVGGDEPASLGQPSGAQILCQAQAHAQVRGEAPGPSSPNR